MSGVYVCVCKKVCEKEVRQCISSGAQTQMDVAQACKAGTGCGTCLERIAMMLEAERPAPAVASALAKAVLF